MPDPLNAEEEKLLQSALETAFTPVPVPKESLIEQQATPPPEAAETTPEASAPAPEAGSSEHASTEDAWKAEYEAHVTEWRKQSAEQRERAEKERKKWEEIRAREREVALARGLDSVYGARSESGWESVGGSVVTSMVLDAATSTAASRASAEPSVADARDLTSGEGQGGRTKEQLEAILPGAHSSHSRNSTSPDTHDKWEDTPSSDSLASSYPSLSFPSDPHSPASHPHPLVHPSQFTHHRHGHDPQQHLEGQATAPPNLPAPSTTLSVFDSSLSPKTRLLALISSLAINIGLPFLNGVMLGFGEIFAKEVVVGWFSWGKSDKRRRPGAREGGVGLRIGSWS